MYQIEEACLPLLDNQMLGPAREELSAGLRAHFFRNYVIYYIPTDMEIIIIRVVRGSRDRRALFTDE